MKVSEIFDLSSAKSKSIDDYSFGDIPFITNTELNNGVVSYVEALDDDKVFTGPAICISGLGHATVHLGDFLPKGNGGDSCTILIAKKPLSTDEIIYYAAIFNLTHSWRFSFGRKCSVNRVKNLDLSPSIDTASVDIKESLDSCYKNMSSLLEKQEKIITQR